MQNNRPQNKPASTKAAWLSLGLGVCGIGLMAAVVAIEPSMATYLTEEDGVFENLTMAAFATASALCALFAFRASGSLRWYLVLWAVLSLVFFGEEVSWGQRWFGFETPDVLSSNRQGEANIHNLPFLTPRVVEGPTDLITSQGAFYMGFFTYFLLIPVAIWLLKPLGRLAGRLGHPAIAPALLAAIWLPIFASFGLAIWTGYGPTREALTETRELYIGMSILAYVLLLVSYAISGSVDAIGSESGTMPDGS